MFKKIKGIHLLKSTIFGFVRYFLLYTLLLPSVLLCQKQQKEVFAKKITSKIIIDGKLDENAWNDIQPAENFTMIEPINGKIERRHQKTIVKFAYDDSGIYVGAELNDQNAGYDDPNIAGIMTELGPRDSEGKSVDMFGIFLNPFNDGINEFGFLVTAAGVQIDKRSILTTNGYMDDVNWDAVWESAVTIEKDGWFVEMKIPYSAIRFPNKEVQEWGINIWRQLRRLREDYSWSFIDVKKRHIGNQSGILKGIENITPPIRLSLTPYLSSILLKEPMEEYNFNYSFGVDLKYGFNLPIGGEDVNFTLDMILLPEFQQVEFDPLVLNISPYETWYDEKRSFFTEGADLFKKGNLFYSKRIGGPPVHDIELGPHDTIISTPENTRLFNATKISGRTEDGWGIGIFNGITRNTYAEIQDTTTLAKREELIEPTTNYNMLVIDKSFNQNSFLTLINTNVTRKENFRNAHVIGALGSVTNKKNTHTYDASIKGSLIKHDQEKESGFSTSFNIQKINNNIQYSIQNYIESDQYNINDMGFLYQNNEINNSATLSYKIFSGEELMAKKLNILKGGITFGTEHQMIYKPLAYNKIIMKFDAWAVSKKHLWMSLKLRHFFEERDYFEARIENKVFIKPPLGKLTLSTSSNFNKPFALNLTGSFGYRFTHNYSVWDEFSNINTYFRINPRFRINNNTFLQYITAIEQKYNEFGWITEDDIQGTIFSRRIRNTVTNKLALNYTFNSKSYIKLIARHYWSTINNRSFYYLNEDGSLINSTYNNNHELNFNTWNLDINFSWEYNPGSFLSIVWQNELTHQNNEVESIFLNNINEFFENPSTNIFSIKFTYYLDYVNLVSKNTK
ncbi:MAG: hypothetical protein CMP56_00540 [Flavobacteriales bacterium]|nr:hypothetical protein [Flavobacteriales bacterium]